MQGAEARLREALARFARLAWERGLIAGLGGNVSARVPGEATILITASGLSLRDTSPENLLKVDLEGTLIEGPRDCRPSKELGMHLAAYRHRPGVGAVFHLHPPHATAFAAWGLALPLVVDGAKARFGRVPCLGYAPSGSPELHRIVEEGLLRHGDAWAFLLKNHGSLVLGRTLEEAFYLSDLLEDAAKIALWSGWVRRGYPELGSGEEGG